MVSHAIQHDPLLPQCKEEASIKTTITATTLANIQEVYTLGTAFSAPVMSATPQSPLTTCRRPWIHTYVCTFYCTTALWKHFKPQAGGRFITANSKSPFSSKCFCANQTTRFKYPYTISQYACSVGAVAENGILGSSFNWFLRGMMCIEALGGL
jgi:hypothetical protein